MKKVLIAITVTLMSVSCAHHDNNIEAEHHHHDQKSASFDGKCAYSVAHDEMKVSGKPEFNFEHQGMIYYFSSEEKMQLFKKDLDKNVRSANTFWENRGGRR